MWRAVATNSIVLPAAQPSVNQTHGAQKLMPQVDVLQRTGAGMQSYLTSKPVLEEEAVLLGALWGLAAFLQGRTVDCDCITRLQLPWQKMLGQCLLLMSSSGQKLHVCKMRAYLTCAAESPAL